VLQKDPKRFKHLWPRCRSVFYSAFVLMFKFHGSPPSGSLSMLFLMYAMVLSFELILSLIFLMHIMNPFSSIWTLGFAYVFILPAITVLGPLLGLAATMVGSPRLMMAYSSMNATMALVNYPLTLFTMCFFKDQAIYVGILTMLFFNKMFLSFFGGKVRQHFKNPAYAKTYEKMQKYLEMSLKADMSGRFKNKTPAEKASALVQKGTPALDKDQHDSDDDDDIPKTMNDDDIFGIKPTSDLKKVDDDNALGNIDMSDPTEAFLQAEQKPKEPKGDVNLDFLSGVVKQAAEHDSAMAGENE